MHYFKQNKSFGRKGGGYAPPRASRRTEVRTYLRQPFTKTTRESMREDIMTAEKFNKGAATKQDILSAAKNILLTQGIGSLSVEATCAKAGLSKGAFFYHFKSRDDLLKGLLKNLTDAQGALYQEFFTKDVLEFGKGLRCYLKATLSLTGSDRENARATCRCMMEMLFSNPQLLVEVGLRPGYYQPLLGDEMLAGMSSEQALLILLACEGLWYDQSLEINGIHPEKIDSTVEFLISLTTRKML